MSIRYGQKITTLISRKSSFYKKNRLDGSIIKKPFSVDAWMRPVDWLAMPAITPSEQKIALLMPVFPQGSNFLAFTIAGAYTVDWGDGSTIEPFTSDQKAQHSYDYADPDLNTTVTSDGYKMAVVIITPQAGQNLTSVDFSRTYTLAGSTFANTTPILEIILSCPNLTSLVLGFCKSLINFSGINMGLLTNYTSLFASLTALKQVSHFHTAAAVTNMTGMFNGCSSLKSVPLFNTAAVTSVSNMFLNCRSLVYVPLFNTVSVTDMSFMFSGCSSLKSVPLFNTAAVTTMANTFSSCSSLKSVPLFNTAAVTNMTGMLSNCLSLVSVPLFNTAAVTSMSGMFGNCPSLVSVPLFNTAAVTNTGGMFNGCSSLVSVPLFNTAAVITMTVMFSGCLSLVSVPLFNTAAVITMSGMLGNCQSLTSVPLFNTAAVTNMSNMFNGCSSLVSVPLFNTAAVTTMSGMFVSCLSIISVPLFNTAAVTTMSSMFNNCPRLTGVPLLNAAAVLVDNFIVMFNTCPSLTRGALSGARFSVSYSGCKLSKEELESIFNNLGTIGAAGQALTITGNWGAPTTITLIGTTTGGSTIITMANTTGIAVGMQVTGTGTPLTAPRAVTFTDAGDLVNVESHGLSDGDEVSFSTITTTTGIIINRIYYVINATGGTFQVAATLGGNALPLTNNGLGAIRYRVEVVSINPNVSVTVSRQMTSGGANNLTFRQLRTGTALLKGWSVIA